MPMWDILVSVNECVLSETLAVGGTFNKKSKQMINEEYFWMCRS